MRRGIATSPRFAAHRRHSVPLTGKSIYLIAPWRGLCGRNIEHCDGVAESLRGFSGFGRISYPLVLGAGWLNSGPGIAHETTPPIAPLHAPDCGPACCEVRTAARRSVRDIRRQTVPPVCRTSLGVGLVALLPSERAGNRPDIAIK